MADRNVVIRDDSSSVASAGLILVAVLIIAAFAAMFVWQPWRAYGLQRSSTTIQVNPGAPGAAGGAGQSNSTGTSGSGSTGDSNSTSGSTSH